MHSRKKISIEASNNYSQDIPLSREANALLSRIKPNIQAGLKAVNKIPVAVLVWGPSLDANHPLAETRLRLRSRLRENGHAALFSEEICDPLSPLSIRVQQLIQAQEFDLIVSLPCTPGSIAEVHDFVADRRVNSKLLVFLNQQDMTGYSQQSLNAISTVITCQIEYYSNQNETYYIEEKTLFEAQRLREVKYILAGRY